MELNLDWLDKAAQAVGLETWTLGIFLLVLTALLLDFLQRRLMKRLTRVVRDSENLWDDALFDAVRGPASFLIWVIGITLALRMVPVAHEDSVFSGNLVSVTRQLGVLIALTWFAVSFVRNIEHNIIETARRGGRKVDQTTVNALGRVVRITVVVTAGLVGLDTMGFSVSGLMAAGGIGGLAIGLAAKDLLANFFGGVTVFIDRPFSVGDWILLKDQGIEGVVEKIGWRQTTIRKFDKRPVYVPNAVFTTASVENPSRMSHRRIYETIGLRYRDTVTMQAVTDEVRQMLQSNDEIDQDQTLMVHFNAFAPSSADFFIYCMTRTTDWQHYHAVKQDVLLKIDAIIRRHGASIAYPTRTLSTDTSPELAGLGEILNDRDEPEKNT